MKDIYIDGFNINEGVYVIAELSANHAGDLSLAKKTILAASETGANAIKLQTYTADTMTIDCHNEYFTIKSGTIWDGQTYHDLYKEAYTPWEWHKELFDYAKSLGLSIFSTPFDNTAVDFLEELNVPAYKIASFEIKDIPLIEYAASKMKPMIMSTGIANFQDIQEAVMACKRVGNDQIILLKCTSSYPAKIEDANLVTMADIKEQFGVHVGVSDHSNSNIIPVVSIGMGACVIEKHIMLDENVVSHDSEFSLTKDEFTDLVKAVRQAEASLGKIDYNSVKKNKIIGRSLFIVEDVKKGDLLTNKNIRSIRPGNGMEPKYYKSVLGRKASMDLSRGTPLAFEHIEGKIDN